MHAIRPPDGDFSSLMVPCLVVLILILLVLGRIRHEKLAAMDVAIGRLQLLNSQVLCVPTSSKETVHG